MIGRLFTGGDDVGICSASSRVGDSLSRLAQAVTRMRAPSTVPDVVFDVSGNESSRTSEDTSSRAGLGFAAQDG